MGALAAGVVGVARLSADSAPTVGRIVGAFNADQACEEAYGTGAQASQAPSEKLICLDFNLVRHVADQKTMDRLCEALARGAKARRVAENGILDWRCVTLS